MDYFPRNPRLSCFPVFFHSHIRHSICTHFLIVFHYKATFCSLHFISPFFLLELSIENITSADPIFVFLFGTSYVLQFRADVPNQQVVVGVIICSTHCLHILHTLSVQMLHNYVVPLLSTAISRYFPNVQFSPRLLKKYVDDNKFIPVTKVQHSNFSFRVPEFQQCFGMICLQPHCSSLPL
jgi:hypothetical protein